MRTLITELRQLADLSESDQRLVERRYPKFKTTESDVLALDNVTHFIDTANIKQADTQALGHAGVIRGDAIVGWHVADSIKSIRKIVKRGGSLQAGYGERGKYAELGPGLYLSAVPHMWSNRSRGKWDFLNELDNNQLDKLCDLLEKEVSAHRSLTDTERQRALRDIKYVRQGAISISSLALLAGLPYSILFWQDSMLRKIGIKASPAPKEFEVKVRGRFAGIDGSQAPRALVGKLRRMGVDGAFIKGGFVGVPQLVVWNSKAVKSISAGQAIENS